MKRKISILCVLIILFIILFLMYSKLARVSDKNGNIIKLSKECINGPNKTWKDFVRFSFRFKCSDRSKKKNNEKDTTINLPGVICSNNLFDDIAYASCKMLMNSNGQEIIDGHILMDGRYFKTSPGWSVFAQVLNITPKQNSTHVKLLFWYNITNPFGSVRSTQPLTIHAYPSGKVDILSNGQITMSFRGV